MRAIILAAGESKRLKPITDTTPKCLLDVSGKSMLGRQLQALKDLNIMDVDIVVGFEREKIVSFIQNNFLDMRIRIINNVVWRDTNNAHSLELALENDVTPFILLNADVVCHPDLIKEIVQNEYADVLGIQEKKTYIPEDMKVLFDFDDDTVLDLGKHIEVDLFYEFTGIAKFTTKDLIVALKEKIKDYRNNWFETALAEVIKDRTNVIYVHDVTHYPSIEVDFAEDLEKARDLFPWGQPDWEQGNRHQSIETQGRNMKDAMELLVDMCKTLDQFEIKWWINWGLLLGATRDGAPIPWDTDMDVTIHTEDETKLIQLVIPEMRRKGCFVVDPAKCFEGDFWFIRDGEKIELNTVHLIWNDKLKREEYSYAPGRCNLNCPRVFLDKLEKVTMFGYEFNTPQNREAYLTGCYGETWKTPIKGKKPVSL